MDEENYNSFSEEESDGKEIYDGNMFESVEDLNKFNSNYLEMKKEYITSPYLNKYEKTRIVSERAQQLANGSIPLIKNTKIFSSVYEIAVEELKQQKIPFIIKRPISEKFEYWKLSDLIYL